jgi:hypothetical protein
MTAGMRAGAIVLIAAAMLIVGALARFALRLWRLAPPEGAPYTAQQ